MKIVCAMSGGVDSSVAAALLVEQGHEVIGLTMRLYDAGARERSRGGRAGTCCSPAEAEYLCDAVARQFRAQPTPDQIVWTYSGVRPLYNDGAKSAQAAGGCLWAPGPCCRQPS